MKVIVLGAGIVGVTSAWFLARAGHEVTVIDRQPGPARETSFANGGQVSTTHSTPWANPSAPADILRWLGHEDAPLVLTYHFRPERVVGDGVSQLCHSASETTCRSRIGVITMVSRHRRIEERCTKACYCRKPVDEAATCSTGDLVLRKFVSCFDLLRDWVCCIHRLHPPWKVVTGWTA